MNIEGNLNNQLECPFCGQRHPFEAQFCPVTGKTLTHQVAHCRQCNAILIPGTTYCTNCGAVQKRKSTPWYLIGSIAFIILGIGVVYLGARTLFNTSRRDVDLGYVPVEMAGGDTVAAQLTDPSPSPTASSTDTPQPSPTQPIAVPTDTPVQPSPTLTPVLPIATNSPAPSSSPTILPETQVASILGYDLAFASDKDGDFKIYLMDSENTADWMVLPLPAGYDYAWWPTFCGENIAAEVVDEGGALPRWIYLLNPERDEATQWDPPGKPAEVSVPRCSGDNRFMGYTFNREGTWILAVAELSREKKVYQSPDDPNVFISGYVSWPQVNYDFYAMVTFRSGFSTIRQTIDFDVPSTHDVLGSSILVQDAKYPGISPDGSKLAFHCKTNNVLYLCLQDLATREIKTIQRIIMHTVQGQVMPGATPMWSADDEWIYFSSADLSNWDIYRIHPDGSGVENLTKDWKTNEMMPAMQW